MVGQRLCERLVELGAARRFAITVLSEEARPAYDRIHLGDVLSGRPSRELWFRQPDWYRSHGISLRLGDGVEAIDLQRLCVSTSSGVETAFDWLVLATGSRAVLGDAKYYTAVYADTAVAPACVTCHNEHKDSPRRDFKQGDVMGGVVIRIPVAG